jgi:hypothetical protein
MILGVKILRKFKTFCLELSAINFQTKLLAPSYILHLLTIYKNVISNDGKIRELDFSGFIWI